MNQAELEKKMADEAIDHEAVDKGAEELIAESKKTKILEP